MGVAGSGGRSAVSDLRFRQLLTADNPEDLRLRMIRAIHLLDRSANITLLSESLFYWNDSQRLAWAEQYYSVAPKIPTINNQHNPR